MDHPLVREQGAASQDGCALLGASHDAFALNPTKAKHSGEFIGGRLLVASGSKRVVD